MNLHQKVLNDCILGEIFFRNLVNYDLDIIDISPTPSVH